MHDMVKEADKLLSTAEVAAQLGVTRQRVLELITEERLPAEKVGRAYVVRSSAVSSLSLLKVGRPPKMTAAPPTTKGEIQRAVKTAQNLNQAFRKAAEDEQQTDKKEGGKK